MFCGRLRISEGDVTADARPPIHSDLVAEFEVRYGVQLPADYREFLVTRGNGGARGPRYGLLPLGVVPAHWARVHDYVSKLQRSFPLTREWVWEDEPDAVNLDGRVAAVHDGVLLLGEEGCGARWILVVRGRAAGGVWLCTGEGAAPTGLPFVQWLSRLEQDGLAWWSKLVAGWGPSPGIWFASHAVKQSYVGGHEGALAQSSPLCLDCVAFLARACAHDGRPLAVQTPDRRWYFSAEGAVQEQIAGSERS